jgi:hypothetical protein
MLAPKASAPGRAAGGRVGLVFKVWSPVGPAGKGSVSVFVMRCTFYAPRLTVQ